MSTFQVVFALISRPNKVLLQRCAMVLDLGLIACLVSSCRVLRYPSRPYRASVQQGTPNCTGYRFKTCQKRIVGIRFVSASRSPFSLRVSLLGSQWVRQHKTNSKPSRLLATSQTDGPPAPRSKHARQQAPTTGEASYLALRRHAPRESY